MSQQAVTAEDGQRAPVKELSGPEKAAILLLSLSDEHTATLLSYMDDEEIKELSQYMANLGTVNASQVEKLYMEFAEKISDTGSLVGTIDSTERLLTKVLGPDKVATIMEEIRGPAGRTMWDKLGNVNEQVLANYLKNEYPQTVAVVLSKIRPDHAARVLSLLPESFAMEVIMRMLRMENVQKEVLDDVERTLRNEFMSNLARTNRRDSHEMMADIFNNLDRAAEARFLGALEERNRDSAERIKSLMFTFEDLGNLDPSGVQALIRAVDKTKLALGMKGASETLRDLFFSNMSERAAKILREDMQAMGPVRVRDVDDAQQVLVNTAKELADKGEIIIADGKGEDQLVY
jgi:flagellar motor switch protein FliG